MKMRVSIKILLWFWAILIVAVGFLSYMANQKFNSDSIVSMLQREVQRNYPGSVLEVGNFEHQIALDFNVLVKNIILRRSDRVLGRLNEIEIKVPWWVLLFERGNAQVNLNGLEIYVDEKKTASAPAPTSPVASEETHVVADDQVTFSVPESLLQIKFTLRAKNISIMDLHSFRRYLRVSKLLVREFRYGKNSAFEVNIPLEVNYKGATHSSELWLFGDVTPTHESWEMNYRGELRSKDTREGWAIEDFIVDGKTRFMPRSLDTASTVVLTLDKTEVGSGKLHANHSELTGDFTFNKIPLDAFAVFADDLKNPYLPSIAGAGDGFLKIKKQFRPGVMELQGNLAFEGDFYLNNKSFIKGKWQIGLENTRWEASFSSPQSEVTYLRRSLLGQEKPGQFVEELAFSGVDFLSVVGSVSPLSKLLETQNYFTSSVSFKNCLWAEKAVNGEFRYGTSPNQKYYQADLDAPEGELALKYQLNGTLNRLEMKVQDFPWQDNFAFLLPYFGATEAKLHGSLQGKWENTWQDGQWVGDMKLAELATTRGSWFDFTRTFWQVFELTDIGIPAQSIKGQVKSKTLKIDSMMLEGNDPVKLTGQIHFAGNTKSHLVLSHPKNPKLKPVKKVISESLWRKE